VHVPSLPTDEGLIHFDFAVTATEFLSKEVILQGQAETLEHEPCGLLSNPKSPSDLATADTVLAIDQHPKCRHPFVESKRRILKDAAQLDSELLLASLAEPKKARLNERVFPLAASWTGNPLVWPAQIDRIQESSLWVREVNDCFLQCLWRLHD
jgi:hypothetical protein